MAYDRVRADGSVDAGQCTLGMPCLSGLHIGDEITLTATPAEMVNGSGAKCTGSDDVTLPKKSKTKPNNVCQFWVDSLDEDITRTVSFDTKSVSINDGSDESNLGFVSYVIERVGAWDVAGNCTSFTNNICKIDETSLQEGAKVTLKAKPNSTGVSGIWLDGSICVNSKRHRISASSIFSLMAKN